MRRAYKFRLFTNRTQEAELASILETHRRLYNHCLRLRKDAWERDGRGITVYQQSNWFTGERSENEWYKALNSTSARATIWRLDEAFKNFFRRIKAGKKPGYPRFKGKDDFNSFEFPYFGKDGIRLREERLYVHGVETPIRIKLHRGIIGTPKNAHVKRETGKWYLVVIAEQLDQTVTPKPDATELGIDVGLAHFLTTSEGETVKNPRLLKGELQELRRAQRAVSRKKKGGSNRRKAVKVVSRLHSRIRNLRKDNHHKVALNIVRRASMIAVEDLNIQGMTRNTKLAQAILDAGWGQFLAILKYKAEERGVPFVAVPSAYTSQTCSVCSHCEAANRPDQPTFHCQRCGHQCNADKNAARVILARARQVRTVPGAADPAGSTPALTHPSQPAKSVAGRRGKGVARSSKRPIAIIATVTPANGGVMNENPGTARESQVFSQLAFAFFEDEASPASGGDGSQPLAEQQAKPRKRGRK